MLTKHEPTGRLRGRRSHVRLTGREIGNISEEIAAATGQRVTDFVTAFELIAGDCTMGLAQRKFGAEPLSLLRFSGPVPRTAIRGLDTLFAGIGEGLAAVPDPVAGHEWMIDDEFGFRSHSGMKVAQVSADAVVSAYRAKVRFLLRKFLEDLDGEGKTFIFSDRDDGPLCAALPLLLALRRHGDHGMLWVVPGGSENSGAVEEIRPGLFHAHIAPSWSAEAWMAVWYNTWLLLRAACQPAPPAEAASERLSVALGA